MGSSQSKTKAGSSAPAVIKSAAPPPAAAPVKSARRSIQKSATRSVAKLRSSVKSTPQRRYKEGLVSRAEMDLEANPAADFYRYVNGGWIDNNPVPGDRSRWGSFEQVAESITTQLHKIVNDSPNIKGDSAELVAKFWKAAMNTTAIEAAGAAPVQPLLDEIAAVTSPATLAPVLAKLHLAGVNPMFHYEVMGDFKNSEQEVFWLTGTNFGLPDRDYYFDEGKQEQRDQYLAFVTSMFQLTGESAETAAVSAKTVFELETVLASASLTRTDSGNPELVYHPSSLEDAIAMLAPFDLEAYLRELGAWDRLQVEEKGPIVVSVPNYFKEGVKAVFEKFSIEQVQVYLRFCVFDTAAKYLSSDFENLHFEFHAKTLGGQAEMKPRWKRVLDVLQFEIAGGQGLGRLFCEKHFPTSSKTLMLEYIDDILAALGERIDGLEWMSSETKAKAHLKLKAFRPKIGFPEKWTDLSGLSLADGFWTNVALSRNHSNKLRLEDINSAPDPTRWEMPPQMVNAYFHPVTNDIVFPAAILQSPFFSVEMDPALAFGGIGAVIGHECTHGFDPQGRKFDHEGNMVDWWTKDDEKNYLVKAQKVIDYYSTFKVHDLNINGDMTKGENVADIGGLTVAYYAMQRYFKRHGRQPDLDGFTAEQRFFISFARVWRNNITKAQAVQRVTTDVHSPGRVRTLGTMSQIGPLFYEAFGVKEGDAMYLEPSLRADIW